MNMKRLSTVGLLFMLTGCSAQRYADIQVWTSAAETNSDRIATLPAEHLISLRADNARVEDIVRKVANHEKWNVRLDAELEHDFCTVNLLNVTPLSGLNSLLEMHHCAAVLTNGMLLVTKTETGNGS